LEGNGDARLISGLWQGIRVYSAYVPNGRDPSNPAFETKLGWIDGLRAVLFPRGEAATPLVLAGDFNVAPEPIDVYNPEAEDGHILYHPAERAAAKRLLAAGLVDAFRCKRREPGLYSWWDYRQGAFRRNLGFRIDHVWASPSLAERVVDAAIDVEERRKPSPSDHAPVVVELDLDR
jgi:exodeoxyribonuclease-3